MNFHDHGGIRHFETNPYLQDFQVRKSFENSSRIPCWRGQNKINSNSNHTNFHPLTPLSDPSRITAMVHVEIVLLDEVQLLLGSLGSAIFCWAHCCHNCGKQECTASRNGGCQKFMASTMVDFINLWPPWTRTPRIYLMAVRRTSSSTVMFWASMLKLRSVVSYRQRLKKMLETTQYAGSGTFQKPCSLFRYVLECRNQGE